MVLGRAFDAGSIIKFLLEVALGAYVDFFINFNLNYMA
jgi:hypothetical protein